MTSVNVNAPFGFQHLGFSQGGAVANFGMLHRKVASNYGVALYEGDVMVDLGSGYCRRFITADAGSNVVGIVKGFEYLSTAQGKRIVTNYLPVGDTAYDVEVILTPIMGVPPQLFKVQATATYFTIADIGTNIEPAVSATGSVNGGYGKSAMTITQGTNAGTTATYPFRVVDLYSSIAPTGTPGTDDTSNYNIVIVQSNPFNATGI
jgi:hypothetical protein